VRILILEDNPERRQLMQGCLADRFPQFDVEFFVASAPMLVRLRNVPDDDVALICLDHDLELLPDGTGRCIDPGTGRDVADALAARPPFCPVVLHSTNAPAVAGMQAVLEDAGWTVVVVTPFDGHHWIEVAWFRAVRNAIVDSVPLVVAAG
jgi:CheY-like chemotaxis protein